MSEKEELSQEIKDRIERNRQKALLLKQSKIVANRNANSDNSDGVSGRGVKVQGKNVIDSGAGFLIEEDDFEEEMKKIAEDAPAPILSGMPICEECKKEFKDSFLLQKFDYPVCDSCRDNEDKHALITKTEAKEEYLLKDHDFDQREPPLKFIVRKNPHNPRWGEMKLFLQLQVEERALLVWGSEEKIIEEKEKRDMMREENKLKNYNRKIKKLRMEVRSSLFDKTTKSSHTHEYGPERYNESDDNYSQKCKTCGFVHTYEKL